MQVSACKVELGWGWGWYRQYGLQREGRAGEGRDEGTCARFHLLNYTCRQVKGGIEGAATGKESVQGK